MRWALVVPSKRRDDRWGEVSLQVDAGARDGLVRLDVMGDQTLARPSISPEAAELLADALREGARVARESRARAYDQETDPVTADAADDRERSRAV